MRKQARLNRNKQSNIEIRSWRRLTGTLLGVGLTAVLGCGQTDLPRQETGAASALSASSASTTTTVCQYTWSGGATGWRTRAWQHSDCSNGLPTSDAVAIGQGENGAGTSGQVTCTATSGSHYNHPTWAGAASSVVRCLYVDPADTQATMCSYKWSSSQTGWRSRAWQASDCSNGLPPGTWRGVGQGQNGSGMAGMADCTVTTQGSHYNHPTYDGATNAVLKCLYVSPTHPSMTRCSYGWTSYASGWRTHAWQRGECSNGLPALGSWSVGNTRNGSGAGFQASCTPTAGSHYNHPTNGGITNGFVDCLHVASAPPAPPPPVRNAIRRASGEFLPVYKVTGGGAVTNVGFTRNGATVTALDQTEAQLWSVTAPGEALSGGFDFDADGWPDVGYVYRTASSETCGSATKSYTSIRFLSGRTGQLYAPVVPLLDLCWSFPGYLPYTTSQWTTLSVLFGPMSAKLGLFPYYATTAWFFGFANGNFVSDGALYFPSTSSYDSTYSNDRPTAGGNGTNYVENSHSANGLLQSTSGGVRSALFTTGRAMVYDYGALSASQLRYDQPYVSGGRPETGGRNYGAVAVDPGWTENIILVAGADTSTVLADLKKGYVDLTLLSGASAPSDPWGGIVRHISIYDTSNNTVADRFYSYAYDQSGGHRYENRIVTPANPVVKVAGLASRVAYNVYASGRWALHISTPGGTGDALVHRDLLLWDIADVDNDGVDELIASPTRWDAVMGNYYFPSWETRLYHWDESGRALVLRKTLSGVVPHLVATFRQGTLTTSNQWLFPVLRTFVGGQPRIVVTNSIWQVAEVAP